MDDHIVNHPSVGTVANRKVSRSHPDMKLVVARIECSVLTDVARYGLWVGIILALWTVDGWVKIWSFCGNDWGRFLVIRLCYYLIGQIHG
jgi:hypothetical protein